MFSVEKSERYLNVFVGWCRGVIYIVALVEGGTPVLQELWDESGPKRCPIVEKFSTGSYEVTLSRIGLSYIGFEGFLLRLFLSGALFSDSAGTRWCL